MNERYTFILAAAVADLIASSLIYLASPSSPFCAAFPNLSSYAGQHMLLAIILWLLVLTAAWLAMGHRLIRSRQNLSTRLRLLAWLGLLGVLIDNTVSLYQFSTAPDVITANASSSAVAAAFAQRTLFYALSFAAAVLLSYLVSRTRKPTVTPPPRFGRE